MGRERGMRVERFFSTLGELAGGPSVLDSSGFGRMSGIVGVRFRRKVFAYWRVIPNLPWIEQRVSHRDRRDRGPLNTI